MTDIRIKHTCKWCYVNGSLEGHKPYPNATYKKYQFKLRCPQCGCMRLITSTSKAKAMEDIAAYEEYPDFPK